MYQPKLTRWNEHDIVICKSYRYGSTNTKDQTLIMKNVWLALENKAPFKHQSTDSSNRTQRDTMILRIS